MTKCNIALRNRILSVSVRESKTWVCLQISFYFVFCNVIKFIHFPILNMKEITALDSRQHPGKSIHILSDPCFVNSRFCFKISFTHNCQY